MVVASTSGQAASLGSFVQTARRYWLSVFPIFLREMRRWEARADQIENFKLRGLALDAQRSKRRSLEGAVAFAVLSPPLAQRTAIKALIAYQLIFDYLDTVAEQHSDDPIRNGWQLNQAMLAALDPEAPIGDYYACRGDDDGGYLRALICDCRRALVTLPSFAAVRTQLHDAVTRNIAYQSLNIADASSTFSEFNAWATGQVKPETGMSWWETGAASGSSMSVLVLISNAARIITEDEANLLDAAYYPWICALHTLLDSLADREEDRAVAGHRSLLDHYASDLEAAQRLGSIAAQGFKQVRELRPCARHELIVAAMAGYYLSEPGAASATLVRKEVLATLGALRAPTMCVMRARRWVGQAFPESSRETIGI